MMKTYRWFSLFVVAALLVGALGVLPGKDVAAQVSITTDFLYTQNFDGLGTSATATLPSNWRTDKNGSVRTLGTWAGAVTTTQYRAGDSMSPSAANGIYNYAAGDPASATDRALGWISSSGGTKSGNAYLHLQNNTGADLNSVWISYDVEKYRMGTNAAGFSIQMYYSTDGSTWTNAGSSFLTSFAGADASNNGYASAPGATNSVSGKLLSLPTPIADGDSLYLAWNYAVTSGTTTTNAQGLGIDNVVVSNKYPYHTISLDANIGEWGTTEKLGSASSTDFYVTWDDDYWYFAADGGFSDADYFMIGIDSDPSNEVANTGGTAARCGATFPSENKPNYILVNRQTSYTRESWGWNGSAWDQAAWNPIETSEYDFSGAIGGSTYEVKLKKSAVFSTNEDTSPVAFYLWLSNGSCQIFNAWPSENRNGWTGGDQFLYAHSRFDTTDAGHTPNTYGARIAWATNTLSANSTTYNYFGEDDSSGGNPWLRLTTTASGAGGASCTVRAKMVGTNSFTQPTFEGINRFVDFTLTNCTNLEVNVQMRYEESELNGIAEANTAFYHCSAVPCSAAWTAVSGGAYTRDATNHNLLLTNVPQTQFSYWTIGDSDTPTAITLTDFTASSARNTALLASLALIMLGVGAAVLRRRM